MDTNILAAIISTVLSVFLSIGFTLGIRWYDSNNKKKELNEKFKLYKEYAVECLEKLIYYYKNGKIIYDVIPNDKKEYKLEELNFYFIIKTGNKTESIDPNFIIAIIISFIGEREFLDETEQKLLRRILTKMTPNTWLVRAKYVDKKNNNEIEFSAIFVTDKENNTLSTIDSSLYCMTLKNANPDFLEKILERLESNKFDERIKKIIKKGVE